MSPRCPVTCSGFRRRWFSFWARLARLVSISPFLPLVGHRRRDVLETAVIPSQVNATYGSPFPEVRQNVAVEWRLRPTRLQVAPKVATSWDKTTYTTLQICPLRFQGRRCANLLRGASLAVLVSIRKTTQCADTCCLYTTFARRCLCDNPKGD